MLKCCACVFFAVTDFVDSSLEAQKLPRELRGIFRDRPRAPAESALFGFSSSVLFLVGDVVRRGCQGFNKNS